MGVMSFGQKYPAFPMDGKLKHASGGGQNRPEPPACHSLQVEADWPALGIARN